MSMHGCAVVTALLLSAALQHPEPGFAAELPEPCRLTPVNGRCKAMIERFTFNQKTGTCTSYFYDGCGPVVPFTSLEACRALCETGLKKRAGSGLWYDAVEDDPRHAEVFSKVDAEVQQALAAHPQRGSMGFVHLIWETKQRILKQKYAIEWRSPAELNPQVLFD